MKPSACRKTQIIVSMARLRLTQRQRQAQLLWCRERVDWRVKCCSVVFSDGSGFYLYVSDGHIRAWRRPGERHLPECIHSRHTGPTSSFTVWEAISYNSRSHLVIQLGKVNTTRCIKQIFNPVLLPFIRKESDVHFQKDNARPHTTTATQCALRVYNSPGQQDPQISRQLNT